MLSKIASIETVRINLYRVNLNVFYFEMSEGFFFFRYAISAQKYRKNDNSDSLTKQEATQRILLILNILVDIKTVNMWDFGSPFSL